MWTFDFLRETGMQISESIKEIVRGNKRDFGMTQ